MDIIEIIDAGNKSAGTPLISIVEVEECIPHFRERGLYVQTMEAYEIESGLEIPKIEYSILGLEYEFMGVTRSDEQFKLLNRKLSAAKKCKNPVFFKLWFDESS